MILFPTLIIELPSAPNNFKAIEQRILWGIPVGIGLFIIFHMNLSPWYNTLAGLIFWLTLGVVISRVLATCMIDFTNTKQWMWIAVELAVAGVVYFYMYKVKLYDWM